MRIDIIADLICPWCYIGKRRLDRALAMRPDLPVTRVWRPFQLSPDLPPEGLPRDVFLHVKFGSARSAARIHNALATAGARDGIAFAFDKIRRAPNTLNAHRLVRLANVAGVGNEIVEALFRGYFIEGLDIGDIDLLAAIAADCGLDEIATRRKLATGVGAAEVVAEEHRARRAGIEAVPCFIIEGDFALSGAQEPEMFLPLFDLAALPRALAEV
jgi:predicted DsbA family dithiol-disulfide isomerase